MGHEQVAQGAELFARYAYPPSALGYCGPEGAPPLLARRASGTNAESHLRVRGAAGTDEGFRGVAQAFEGAWPYLELLAGVLGGDPLDPAVVETYWIGGPALDRVEASAFGPFLAERFGAQPGVDWPLVRALVAAGAVPHHSFHVLAIYPWLGLLRAGHEGRPLEVLDRCRIRWGRVIRIDGDDAFVRGRPLAWDGWSLGLGEPREERVDAAIEGHTTVAGLAPGDRVAMHWHWICGRLGQEQVVRLRAATAWHLGLVNAS